VKRTTIGSASYYFLGNAQAPTGTNGVYLGFVSDQLLFGDYGASAWDWNVLSSSLYRDTSAWYHVVAQYDTTQATASERVKLYVNGVRLTAFDGASTYPTPQNVDGRFNQASVETAIGRLGTYNGDYFSGYIAEVNFIDGQALTPSSFGYTDSTTGSWMPKKYVETYGTNGFYLPFENQSSTQNLLTYSEDFGNVAWSKFLSTCTTDATTAPNGTNTADKLVVNNGETYGQFYRAYTAADNTTYTVSVYLKALDFTTGALYLSNKSGGTPYVTFDLTSATITGTLNGALGGTITSVGSGWYRITCTMNSGTGASTTYMYVQFTGNGDGVKGSYIWGAQLEAYSSVGPYMYTAASVQAQTLAIGEDISLPTGGYNSFASSSLSVTPGSNNDRLVDSPTNYGQDTGLGGEVRGNYAVLNQLQKSGATITNGNLDFSLGTTNNQCMANISVNSGKWYCELTVNAPGYLVGIAEATQSFPATYGVSKLWYSSNGNFYDGNTNSGSPGVTYTTGDVIGFALDLDSATTTLKGYKNGTLAGTIASGISGSWYMGFAVDDGTASRTGSWNFGQQAWKYAPPSGYKALCTTNLPIPSIKKSSTFFDAITYNGTGSTFVSPSGLAFAPDLVWVKSRSQNISHVLSDTVRGTGEVLCSNNTRAGSPDSFLTNFNQDGFTLNTSITANNSGSTYVAWAWSRSIIAGMDIVGYVGNDNSGRTISHNLGVTPKMIIVKNRTTLSDWPVYHANLTASNVVFLQLTNAEGAISSYAWGAVSSASSTTFTVIAGNTDIRNVNKSGDNYVAYCFSDVEGFSKFGSYTGNGSEDGPFVYCGFRPRYVLIKRFDAAENWILHDTARDPFNVTVNELLPNSSAAEGSTTPFDILSNGFKIRTNVNNALNTINATHIYAAFAESPFKYARAR